MSNTELFWRHWRAPLALFAVLAPILFITPLDLGIAHALFFDESHAQWIGADSWWTNELLHTGGAWFIRTLVLAATALWACTWWRPQLTELRRPALYFTIAVVLSVSVVGALKMLTNVDCPRDLTEFGGAFPFVPLFSDRPDGLRAAHCFPAAHASCGYALLALYFVLLERGRSVSRLGKAAGLGLGLLFGIAQQSRGAHFLSHDVWSAMLVWTISLSLYTFGFKARLWNFAPLSSAQWECNEANAAAFRLPVDGNADLPHRVGPIPGT